MGWMSGWYSRHELVDHLTTPHQWEKDGQKHMLQVVKKCFKGNNLWAIMEHLVDGQRTHTFIALFMMKRFGEGWGYKDCEETCGPIYYNCPVSWFDEVPDPGSYATEWRAEVRAQASKIKRFKPGQRIVFNRDITFTDGVKAREFLVCRVGRAMRFRRPDGMLCQLSKIVQSSAVVA